MPDEQSNQSRGGPTEVAAGRRCWRFTSYGTDYFIVRRADLRDEDANLLCRYGSGFLDRALSDPFLRPTILDLWSFLRGTSPTVPSQLTTAELRRSFLPDLDRAFRLGELSLLRQVREASAPSIPGPQAATLRDEMIARQETAREAEPSAGQSRRKETPSSETRKTWIGIELIDDDGQPVASERYVITLPDGVRKQGTLDAQGRALIDQIDPGTCQVSFPDLDAREWRRA